MTEEEAKTKWCPFVRMHPGGYNASTHFDGMPDQRYGRCIGSDCMAWRWHQVPAGPPPYSVLKNSNEGYCGLAGKP